MARNGFGGRLRYVLWLHHLFDGEPPGYAEIARGIREITGSSTMSGQTISGWVDRDLPTDSRDNMRALAETLGATEDWLIDGNGDAPRADLWAAWERARRRPTKRTAAQAVAAESTNLRRAQGKD